MKIFVQQVIFLIIFDISFGQDRTPSKHVVDSYFHAEQNCLHQYTLRIGSITKEVKADSLLCLKEADIQLESDKMFEILQEPVKKCSSPESGIKDYFKCFEDIAPENRKKLKKITSEIELLWQNIDEVLQNKAACLSKASSKGNYESTYAVSSLNNCLQSISQQEINSVKEPILVENSSPPGDMNEFLNKLDVIKERYNELKNCTLKENDHFYNCFREANIKEFFWDLRDRLESNSTQYFSKITEIDKADDSCLRQYIVMHLSGDFQFDLKSCLMHGSKQSQESEENLEKDKKLIADLIKEYKEFNKCRDITQYLDINKCVYAKFRVGSSLREIQAAISRKSERNFKSLKTTFLSSYTDQYEYPCIENLYDNLQFDGYNLRSMEKDILFDCLKRGYKPTFALPFENQLIKELNEIQQFLKTCTEHPQSPGYENCFDNVMTVYDTTRNYLRDENSNYSGIVAKHDMLHDTCFEDIVKDMIRATYVYGEILLSQKCLFP